MVEHSTVKMVFGVCNRLAPMVQRAKRIIPHPVYTFCQCAETITSQAVHNLDLARASLPRGAAREGVCAGPADLGAGPASARR